jgi:uncharacterized membrane protein YcaP (DUF421 family)
MAARRIAARALNSSSKGAPEMPIHNGHLYKRMMAKAQITHHELNAALREAGVSSIEEVHSAILENNGTITVTLKNHEGGQSESHYEFQCIAISVLERHRFQP